jgi:hypothetical protein
MGLFDTVRCEYPLPESRHQDLEFQTKNLDCLLLRYTIRRDGTLVRHAGEDAFGIGLERDVEWPIHGDISIYTSDRSAVPSWIEYVVRFTHGRVEWIRPLAEVRRSSAESDGTAVWQPRPAWSKLLPVSESAEDRSSEAPHEDADNAKDAAVPGAEEKLLLNLRRGRADLASLLEECSDHWGYEDPIYRFYHQSFKVYGLQGQTRTVVERLQALAPDRPLHPWFRQIVEAGTGKEFRLTDNERWTEVTRPILEAFFHARFFLEMAVRYADLQAPPSPLPSGYAALLYLFGLR